MANHVADAAVKRIESREAVVGVVGLGYVGLPVAVAFAQEGFSVIGVDLDLDRVEGINRGRSHVRDVGDEIIAPLVKSGRIRGTTTFETLSTADAILICVPTPITRGAQDVSKIVAAGTALGNVLKEGCLVVLESTTYPGSTEELLKPLLERNSRRVGTDFFLAFSPERIDPGNTLYQFGDIPKIVGGVTEDSTRVAASLYSQVVPKVVTVSGAKEAELAKLIENTFRHVNIALVNELAIYAHELGIDIWEAIDAAASKPFGFLPFYPGPGWGGHCIPLDPAYLSWRVRQERAHEVRFVELAQALNAEMPRHVVERVSLLLNDNGQSIRDANVLAIGVAYKAGTDDTREAGALKVLNRLLVRGARVSYHDPLVPEVEIGEERFRSVDLASTPLEDFDIVVILVAQEGVDWNVVSERSRSILDCCNALGKKGGKIKRL